MRFLFPLILFGVALSSSGCLFTNDAAEAPRGSPQTRLAAEVTRFPPPLPNTGPIPFGYFHLSNQAKFLPDVANVGSNYVVLHHSREWPEEEVIRSLSGAAAAGIQVIFAIDRELTAEAMTRDMLITNLVGRYNGYKAIVGWYIAEDPTWREADTQQLRMAYQAVRRKSEKPVFVSFSGNILESQGNPLVKYGDSFDVAIIERYAFREGEPEFSAFEDRARGEAGYKSLINGAKFWARETEKPWWLVTQAFNENGNRFPTYNEARFLFYYALLSGVNESSLGEYHFDARGAPGATGLLFWGFPQAREGKAEPREAYPLSGHDWLGLVGTGERSVGYRLSRELGFLGRALEGGALTGSVEEDSEAVLSEMYLDPLTSEIYLVSVNTSGEDRSVSYFLPGQPAGTMIPAFREALSTLELEDGRFRDSLTPYEVTVYRLKAESLTVKSHPLRAALPEE